MKSTSLKYGAPEPPEIDVARMYGQSRAKLYWARQHIHQLSVLWEEFVELYVDSIVSGKHDARQALEYGPLQPRPPIECAFMIGDAIRNLRSSLDYLVSELARDANLSDSQTIFPFGAEREGVAASFEPPRDSAGKKKGRRAGAMYALSRKYPKLKSIILDKIQPYSAEHGACPLGDILWRVITSDNIYKHRLITPTASVTDVTHAKFGAGKIVNVRLSGGIQFLGSDFKIEPDAEFAVDLLFAEPTRLSKRPVVSTLVEASNSIADVIESFESAFKGEIAS